MTEETDAHTEESIRARSRELLDRTEMTPEEIAEQEARRKANRFAEIMAPKPEIPVAAQIAPQPVAPPAPARRPMTEDEFLAAQDRRRTAKSLKERYDRGERLSADEHARFASDSAGLLFETIEKVMAQNPSDEVKAALAFLSLYTVNTFASAARKREAIEDRLIAIEEIEAKRRNVETTRVLQHDEKGRILTFEKRLEIREDVPPVPPPPTDAIANAMPAKQRVRIKAPTRVSP